VSLLSLSPGTRPRRAIRRVKNAVLPEGERLRRLPVGIGRGLRLSIDFRYRSGLYLGLYEIELNRYLRLFCSPGLAAYDVGAQDGYHALVIARLTSKKVAAFESDADACATLRRSVLANPSIAPRIEVVPAFVTDATDRSCRELRLDDYAAGDDGFLPGLIKMDIEGAELKALRGAKDILRTAHPHLIVETHSAELEARCDEFLRGFGYRPKVVDARGWAEDNRPLVHNRWLVARGAAPLSPGTVTSSRRGLLLDAPTNGVFHFG
jgi:hypothetical protein